MLLTVEESQYFMKSYQKKLSPTTVQKKLGLFKLLQVGLYFGSVTLALSTITCSLLMVVLDFALESEKFGSGSTIVEPDSPIHCNLTIR